MAALCYKSLFSSRNGGDSLSLLFLEQNGGSVVFFSRRSRNGGRACYLSLFPQCLWGKGAS